MKFREFVSWCNERACDGCWGLYEAITCISIMQEVREQHFWKREKYWKEKYEKDVLNEIVNPIEKNDGRNGRCGMNREEAIKLLNDIHSQCCDTANILCTSDADKRCKALQMAITALQNQPVWIPVSERLPEESYGCLVTVMDYNPYSMQDYENIYPKLVGCVGESWYDSDGQMIPLEVLAWMPLPETYRESEE